MTSNTEKVKAKTFWVWTHKAEEENPKRSKAGSPIWYQHQINAPKYMLDDGLICDSTDFVKEGQTDIFDFM